jgi:hypothetical protein
MARMKIQNTMRRIAYSLAAVILAACSQNSNSSPTVPVPSSRPSQISMAASAWQFQYSTNILKNPTAVSATTWEFNFPVNPSNSDGVHYLVTTSPILTGKSTLTMSGLISSGAGTTFVPLTGAGHIDTSGAPATCGSYLEEAGDNLSGAVDNGENYAYYRWWSHSGRVVLANGNFSVTASFTNLSDWSSVFGEFANSTTSTEARSPVTPRQGFAQALANPAYIGITCGGTFFGHGVMAKGTGPAAFRMNSFYVQ